MDVGFSTKVIPLYLIDDIVVEVLPGADFLDRGWCTQDNRFGVGR